MNRAYLSRNDIEQIAKRVIETYKSVAVPQKHLCYVVDPIELADVLGLQVDFQYLTKDGSVLGLTTPEETLIPVLDMDSNPFLYHLDGRTVLIEQRLNNLPRFRGRRNFTVAHEIAHQILYRLFPDAYGMDAARNPVRLPPFQQAAQADHGLDGVASGFFGRGNPPAGRCRAGGNVHLRSGRTHERTEQKILTQQI